MEEEQFGCVAVLCRQSQQVPEGINNAIVATLNSVLDGWPATLQYGRLSEGWFCILRSKDGNFRNHIASEPFPCQLKQAVRGMLFGMQMAGWRDCGPTTDMKGWEFTMPSAAVFPMNINQIDAIDLQGRLNPDFVVRYCNQCGGQLRHGGHRNCV